MAKAPTLWIAYFYGIPVVTLPSPHRGRDLGVASHLAKPTGGGRVGNQEPPHCGAGGDLNHGPEGGADVKMGGSVPKKIIESKHGIQLEITMKMRKHSFFFF